MGSFARSLTTKRYMKKFITFYTLFLYFASADAQNTVTQFIRLDQFGYLPAAKKVAVIADPVAGFNEAQAFSPGNNYQVVRAIDNQVVFSGAPIAWKNGATHN